MISLPSLRFATTLLLLASAAPRFIHAMPAAQAITDTTITTTAATTAPFPTSTGTTNGTAPSNTTAPALTTTIDYLIAGGYQVATGNITADATRCFKINSYAYGIHSLPEHECTLRLWSGSLGCDPSRTYKDVPIPAGDSTARTVVYTGVVDGGVHYWASGIYSCA